MTSAVPFLDDAGIIRENHRGPVIGALAVFGEQVERMVGTSLAWSSTLIPAAAALAFPGLPAWLRVTLLAVSSLALVPATGALHALAARALAGDEVGVRAAVDAVRSMTTASLRVLAPLFALTFAVGWTAVVVTAELDVLIIEVVLQLAVLILLTCALYWGPLLAAVPDASAMGVLRGSVTLVRRHPGTTLRVALVTLVIAAIGVVTVAGAALAAPVALALMHANLLDQVAGARDE